MAQYEMVRQIQNLCRNNQMRDVFFQEVETDDPMEYVRSMLRGSVIELSQELRGDGGVTVYASVDGLIQTFTFTPV